MGARCAEMGHLWFCDSGVDSRHRSRQGCRKVPANQKAFGRPSWSGLGQIWGPDTRKWLTCGSVIEGAARGPGKTCQIMNKFFKSIKHKSRTNQNCRGTIRAAAKAPVKGQAMVPARIRQGSWHTLKVVYGKVAANGSGIVPVNVPK